MPEDITTGVSNLSIHSHVKATNDEKQTLKKPKKWYRHEQWIYGYHLKNKHFRRISQKCGLPWQKRPLTTMRRVISHIMVASNCTFRLDSVDHGNDSALILYFVKSDGRKRMKGSMASVEDMDRVRKALGLPKGKKPKWYNCYGCDEYDNAVDSSEDEARPVSRVRGLPPPRDVSDFDRSNESCQASDASMTSDSDYEYDSDETSSDDSSEDDTDNE